MENTSTTTHRFPLFALAATFFGIGVTEFISVGVLPAVARTFDISTTTAGLITSIYALGAAIGAPLLTILTANYRKKDTIIGAIVIFILGHILIGLAPTFFLVLVGRFIAAMAHGLLFALSSTIAAELVGESKQASAIAYIFSGFTIATAIGAPLGTSISDWLGWRVPFLIIAVLGIIALILNIIALPNKSVNVLEKATLTSQFKLAFHHHVLLTLLVTILGYGGTFATFTYLSPILEQVTGIGQQYISLVLIVYGVSIAIGNTLGGKIGNSEQSPLKSLLLIFILQGLALVSFFFTVVNPITSIINIIVLGLLAFMSVPILQSYILSLARSYVPEAIDMASSLNITSFNLGIVLGAFVGGKAINIWGLQSTTLAASIMLGLAIVLTLIEIPIENKRSK